MNRLAMRWPGLKAFGVKGLSLIAASLLGVTAVQAGGFANPNMSASGLGVANAVVASADDVSAAAYNPAGIAWQDGIQAMAGVDVQFRNSSVELGSGIGSNGGGAANINHLYASWMPRDGSVGVALGYGTPYEIDNSWAAVFPGLTGQTALNIDRLSVDLIYSHSSSLAIALGGDWYLSSANLSQGAQVFSGKDNFSFGGHVSLKWKPAPMWSVGALFRKGAKIGFSGNAGESLGVTLPDELTVGVAHDVADAVRLELDANWTRWSKLSNLNVISGAATLQSNALDMKDSLTLMAGATWFWRENSQIRFGYAYDQGASNSSAFHPALADQTGHQLSLGAGGDMFGTHADLAYAYTYYPKKTVTGTFAGIYRDRRHSLALSVTKSF